ncbi:MAG: PEP/pyruvate-binding domain-containing protein, partial [Polyangiales bacterium]
IAEGNAAAIDRVRLILAQAGGCVAVRSSAIGEDGANASFAGQHATILHVRTEAELVDAIVRVWASARTDSAMGYRARLGIIGAPRMAIVVQELIDAECAGVLFTRAPMTGHDERVIEAAWGLGEIVVAGLVTPDRYRVSRTGEILERSPGEKDIAIRPSLEGGTMEVAVEEHLVNAHCLDDARLLQLHALASACEAHHDGPHDIEFAFTRERLYLLQRRAITRHSKDTRGGAGRG